MAQVAQPDHSSSKALGMLSSPYEASLACSAAPAGLRLHTHVLFRKAEAIMTGIIMRTCKQDRWRKGSATCHMRAQRPKPVHTNRAVLGRPL